MVIGGKITLKEAGNLMGVSYRQAKRMKRKLISEGAKGLIHGNRGKPSPRALNSELIKKILDLSLTTYTHFNDTHFIQKLREEEGIIVSRDTVTRLRRTNEITPKRRRKAKRHFKRRDRGSQEGTMVLWDGSPHLWFAKDHAPCCLMAGIDAATGKLCEAFFVPYECSFGYLKLLKSIVSTYGIPASIYKDRHSTLRRNDDHWILEEQLAEEQEPAEVGGVLKSLGSTPIFALTPQAKGRTERLFGVLQDRLIAEMGLRNITEMVGPNMFLSEHFIADYNRRFAIDPEVSQQAWRKVVKPLDIERTISFRYQAVVGNDVRIIKGMNHGQVPSSLNLHAGL
jgi:transposase